MKTMKTINRIIALTLMVVLFCFCGLAFGDKVNEEGGLGDDVIGRVEGRVEDSVEGRVEDSVENYVGDDVGFIFPIGLARQVEQLSQQVGLINAQVTGIDSRINNLEMEVTAQAGLVNKISTNLGTQVFTGDVAAITIAGLVILTVVIIWGAFYYRKAILTERATELLAHTKSEDEALELAKSQKDGVKKIMERAVKH